MSARLKNFQPISGAHCWQCCCQHHFILFVTSYLIWDSEAGAEYWTLHQCTAFVPHRSKPRMSLPSMVLLVWQRYNFCNSYVIYFCSLSKTRPVTRAKDVLPNTNNTQATEIIPPGQHRNGPVFCCMTLFAASAFHPIAARVDGSAQCIFCPWWLWPLTLTFKLVQARDETRFPHEFGANLFRRSRDIWFTNKKVTDSTKNRTYTVYCMR